MGSKAPVPNITAALPVITAASTTTKRKVVLPEGLSGHHTLPHHDPWHQWEGLVVILVVVHLMALVFYVWVLYSGDAAKRRSGKEHGSRASSQHKLSGPWRSTEWRSPKEILAAYQKQRLGKT
eukprot:CAMPEP_0202899974 /NCGR_PEP_ID=MMETSP1392-20130828/9359_1 /ASSEMBLY_ACC=CAM_ASM_000868 /TAXON_ID=225041 /ORGANISM="Chlamydomonas chlamydogama, Strain SAG 11-48b" /LENGTH=122 /DNA_ID=CAMNT_0049586279 /DNA_START=332 /DNA_END=700 /DNA_ORIENTATION=-